VGLVKTNEEFFKWLTGETTLPFGEKNRHVPVRLVDFDNLPDPDVMANEIIENIEAGLESFREIVATLNGRS
jgi:hypothetical protein